MQPIGGYTYYIFSTDGSRWSEPQPVRMADGRAMNGVMEQDPYLMADGRIVGAAHSNLDYTLSPSTLTTLQGIAAGTEDT